MYYKEAKNLSEYLIKKNKINNTNVRLDEDDYNKLKKIAEENKISISQIVRNSVHLFLADYEKFEKFM